GQFAAFGGQLYFANSEPGHGVELWRSDGTAAGTQPVGDLNPGRAGSYPGNLTVVDGALYFSGVSSQGESALWSSNGTAAGTNVVANVGPEVTGGAFVGSIAHASAVAGGTLFFAADDGTDGTALWKSDGTSAGTKKVKVLAPGPYALYPVGFTPVGRRVYFFTQDP